MKLIFLDIDGVLNSETTTLQTKSGFDLVDIDKVLLLKQLIDETGAKVVLSSSWRYGWVNATAEDLVKDNPIYQDFCELRDLLKEYGIVLSYKTRTEMSVPSRATEILGFLKGWGGEEIENYVILDDEPYTSILEKNWVKTETEIGLTEEHLNKALRILKGE